MAASEYKGKSLSIYDLYTLGNTLYRATFGGVLRWNTTTSDWERIGFNVPVKFVSDAFLPSIVWATNEISYMRLVA